jgi:hypothetical protein
MINRFRCNCQKGIKGRSVTPQGWRNLSAFVLRKVANVKKVPNARVQGLDLGESGFRDFPFRLWKSLK